jgi:hypothetical protein
VVYITRGLVDVLLSLAEDADPDDFSAGLAVMPAGELQDRTNVSPETPVFTDFYLPEAGRSVSKVFGVDLGTPPAQTNGRFVSHPAGNLAVSRTDDLHATVFVAVPPWTSDSMAAFDRSGRRLDLEVLDARPPRESFA